MADDVALIDEAMDRWREYDSELDVEAIRIVLTFHRIHYFGLRAIDAEFARHGIDSGEYDVLAALTLTQGIELNQRALVDLTLLSPTGMSARLDRMEKAGLIARKKHSTDRRSHAVVLTAKGRRLVERSSRPHNAILTDIISPFTEQERREFLRLSRKLLGHVSSDDFPAVEAR